MYSIDLSPFTFILRQIIIIPVGIIIVIVIRTMAMKKEVEEFVGKKAIYEPDLSLAFEVKVLDVKISYGNKRYLVTPVAGTGERWVESIKLIK